MQAMSAQFIGRVSWPVRGVPFVPSLTGVPVFAPAFSTTTPPGLVPRLEPEALAPVYPTCPEGGPCSWPWN